MRNKRAMSPRDAAQKLDLRLDTVYALLWAGRLRGQKREGRWYVAADSVTERLKARKSHAG
jgi:hypothetical protein